MSGPPPGDPITIVGAGPAGLAAAIVLARAGRPVMVREWHDTVGRRFHDDFQGLENWSGADDVLDEMAGHGLAADFECHPVREGVVFDPTGGPRHVQSTRPLYYVVRRGSGEGMLDRALLRQAQRAGVDVRFNSRVDRFEGDGVLAGGPRVAQAIAVGYTFATEMPDGDWLALGNRLAPHGYAYLLVHGGHGTLATCLFTDFKRQANCLERTVAFFEARAGLTMRAPRSFGGFVNARLPRHAMQGGHPVIGEQAGFQDALAGFGMRYALRSGVLAARCLIEGTSYEAMWRRELGPALRTAIVNRMLFNMLGERAWTHAVARLATGDAGAALRRFYQPSWLSRLLFPVALRLYRRPLRDPSCDHQDCHCVWCTCQTGRA